MILRELLFILENQALLESYGNLKIIDKTLLTVFMDSGKIQKNIGADSTVEDVSDIKKYEDVLDYLNNNRAIGVIISWNDEQIFAIGDIHAAGRERETVHEPTTTKFTATENIYKLLDTHPEVLEKSPWFMRSFVIAVERKMAASIVHRHEVEAFIKLIFDKAKEKNAKLTFMTVHGDDERKEKKTLRANLRKGKIPLPTAGESTSEIDEYKQYLYGLKKSLLKRLVDFKDVKIPNSASQAELINFLTKAGYEERINFMGFAYERKRFNISLDHLHSIAKGEPPSTFTNNTIDYEIDDTTQKFRKIQEELWELAGTLPSTKEKESMNADDLDSAEALWAAFERKRKRVLPPSGLTVVVAIKGIALVPTEIKLKDR